MPRARVVAVLLALSLSAGAAAQGRTGPVSAKDRRGDAGDGGLDVVRVALGRNSDGRLRAELTMADAWDAATLRTGNEPGSVCLRLYTKRDPEAEPPDFLVCASPTPAGENVTASVFRDRSNGLPTRVGTVRASRPTERTIFMKFSQSSIGKPATVRFAAETRSTADGCPPTVGCRDLAPRAPRTRTLTLRQAADSR